MSAPSQSVPFDLDTTDDAVGEKLLVNFNFRMTYEQAENLAAAASSLAVDRGKIARWAIEHAAEAVADGWYLERLGAKPPTIESLTVHLRRLMTAEALASRSMITQCVGGLEVAAAGQRARPTILT